MFFLILKGVNPADPVLANPWFAIPKSSPSYQEMISILMSSKLSGRPLHVITDGSLSCGLATVSGIGFSS